MTRAQSRKEQAETREKRTRLHDHFNKNQRISELRYALDVIDFRDTAQQYPVQPSASLLRLPGEMRNIIYEASLREPHMLFLDTLAAPAMCQVSSQSRKEAATLFIAENSFFTLVSRQTFSLEGNIDPRSSIHTCLDRATSNWLRNTMGLSNPLFRDIAFGFDYREKSDVVPWEAYPVFRLRPRTKNSELVLSHWACRLCDNAENTGYGNSQYDPDVPTLNVYHSAFPEYCRLKYMLLRKGHDRSLDVLNQEDAIKVIGTSGASILDIIKVAQCLHRAYPPGDGSSRMVRPENKSASPSGTSSSGNESSVRQLLRFDGESLRRTPKIELLLELGNGLDDWILGSHKDTALRRSRDCAGRHDCGGYNRMTGHDPIGPERKNDLIRELSQVKLLPSVNFPSIVTVLTYATEECNYTFFTIYPCENGSKTRRVLRPLSTKLPYLSIETDSAVIPIAVQQAAERAKTNHDYTLGRWNSMDWTGADRQARGLSIKRLIDLSRSLGVRHGNTLLRALNHLPNYREAEERMEMRSEFGRIARALASGIVTNDLDRDSMVNTIQNPYWQDLTNDTILSLLTFTPILPESEDG